MEELLAQEKALSEQLSAVRAAIKKSRLDRAEAEFGVHVGCVVVYKGEECRVTEVDARWDGKPWVQGNPKRKDGTFGTAVRNLYSNWELVASHVAP